MRLHLRSITTGCNFTLSTIDIFLLLRVSLGVVTFLMELNKKMHSYFRVYARLLLSARRQLMTGSFLSSFGIFHARLRIGPGGGGRKKDSEMLARALKDRRNVKSRKKPEGYRYAGEVKQNRNETVKRRFDGTSIKARDDGKRENLFIGKEFIFVEHVPRSR